MQLFKFSILASFALLLSCTQNSVFQEQVLRGSTMGTSFSIKVVTKNAMDSATLNDLKTDVENELRQLNMHMSTYIPQSELSCFNASEENVWFPVSDNLFKVIQTADKVSEKSNGAFDITVGTLVNLWGFGPEHQKSSIPSDQEVEKRQRSVGHEKLLLQNDPPAVQKTVKELYCDLSAIAKGFGVDVIAELVEAKGYKNYLVEIGGEIRARGHNAKNAKWRIGVSSPDGSQNIQRIINVLDVGIATSGDYRNYFEENGTRYSHTIDPRTGRPITHTLASVTVIHESCMMADAFATAINVLGPEKGWELAERENLAVLLILKNENGFAEKINNAFKKFLHK